MNARWLSHTNANSESPMAIRQLPGTEHRPGWKGKLVTDDFSGYKACFELGVTEVGCMAHARQMHAEFALLRKPV